MPSLQPPHPPRQPPTLPRNLGPGPGLCFAFYGRVSTEDQQDPESSRAWQRSRARSLIEPHGGVIVAEYFDLGLSRALPWQRRPHAARLLAALATPDRGFQAVVIGEPHRAFYGNQFSLTFPLFTHYDVALWVPEIGGPIDPGSEAHDLAMTLFGSTSKGERLRIKTRVRAGMAAHAALQGRFLGGRPPYGYQLADAGPHPNPAKAALGARLHRLVPDPVTAPVVKRIFGLFVDGLGYYAIAEQLTRDGVPSPAAHDPARNPHRDGRAWNKHAVRAILQNPRYTGYQVWNRQRRDEVLLDVQDVAAGYTTRLRWNQPDAWVWSATPAHEPLLSREVFDAAQAIISSRARTTPGATTTTPRKPRATPRPYVLRSLLRCGLCTRLMQGHWVHQQAYYRCRYPANYALATTTDHPKSVFLREADLVPHLDGWIGKLFSPANLAATCQQLALATRQPPADTLSTSGEIQALQHRLRELEQTLARYRAMLDGGADPQVITAWINEVAASQQRLRARLAELRHRAATSPILTAAQVRRLLEDLGIDTIPARLATADPDEHALLYQQLGLELVYRPAERRIAASADVGRFIESVGGGT